MVRPIPPRELIGHRKRIAAVAFFADGRTLASAGSWDRTVRLWDVVTGDTRAVLESDWSTLQLPIRPGPSCAQAIRSLAVAPAGTRVYAGGQGDKASAADMVVAWDAADGWTPRVLELSEASLRLSPDGRLLVAGDQVWDTSREQTVHRLEGVMAPFAFSPDGAVFAATLRHHWNRLGRRVALYDTAGWSPIGELDYRPVLTAPEDRSGLTDLAFSPDGRHLAAGSHEGIVTLCGWRDGAAAEPIVRKDLSFRIRLAFAPDGRSLAVGSRKIVLLWDAGELRDRLALEHPTQVDALAFSPDGRLLATGGDDGIVRLWDLS